MDSTKAGRRDVLEAQRDSYPTNLFRRRGKSCDRTSAPGNAGVENVLSLLGRLEQDHAVPAMRGHVDHFAVAAWERRNSSSSASSPAGQPTLP